MHFGRQYSGDFEWALPEDSPRTSKLLSLFDAGKGTTAVGAPLWGCKEWVGSLYPASAKSGDFLMHYGKQLSTVELNATFYRVPDEDRVRAWCGSVPGAFRFFPKVNREVTEGLGQPGWRRLLTEFLGVVGRFGSKLGGCFATFNESVGPDAGSKLVEFLEAWSVDIPLYIEVRHPGWFQEHSLIDPWVNALYRKGVATVITDTPGRRDALHTSLTAPRVMIRFLCCRDTEVDAQRMEDWAKRVQRWTQAGAKDVDVFVHATPDAAIPNAVSEFQAAVSQRPLVLHGGYLPGLAPV